MADWIDNEIAANKDNARARGRAERDDFPHATAAAYSPAHDLIVIDLENGSKFNGQATVPDIGRSAVLTAVLNDEAAEQDDAEAIASAIVSVCR